MEMGFTGVNDAIKIGKSDTSNKLERTITFD